MRGIWIVPVFASILIVSSISLMPNAFADPLTLFHTTFVDSFSVGGQEAFPTGVAFSSDGTKMFVVGNDVDDVNEYTLTSPFDVSTASFVDSFSVFAQDTVPHGLAFSSDGTKMFVVGSSGDDVNEYTLTAAFDVSTASFVDSFSVAAQETNPRGLAFSSDGTKMFVVGGAGDDVNEYTLTAFDVSTASFVDSFSVAGQETFPSDVAFSSDGTKMFVVGTFGDDVNEYTLTAAFDVSTASFVDSFSVLAQEGSPTGVAFSSDGIKMFVVGTVGDDVNEYILATEFRVPTITSAVWDDPDNGDTVLSAGDILTLTFDIATNAPSVSNQAAIDPIVNVAGLFGTTATYSGAWSTGDIVLTITIGSVGTASSVIGGNVGPGVTSVTNAAGTSGVWSNTISTTGDFGTCSPPSSGDWIITSSCTLTNSASAPANVKVQNNVVLTIPSGLTLTIDFSQFNLTVEFGSGVRIKAGGTISSPAGGLG